MSQSVAIPAGMLAELTHRCPLSCAYCSNPVELDRPNQELDTATWKRVLSEAAALGVLHVHLSGGEPASRRDLVELVAHCAEVGLYSNLITSGIGISRKMFDALNAAGLDHLQLSVQDADAASADYIGKYHGGFAKKRELAEWVVACDMPLTVNAVIHRANVTRAGQMVDLAVALGARRIEIAHTQYYGWALRNRANLMPTRAQSEAAYAEVEAKRAHYAGQIVVDHVVPDYHAKYPKACMSGWGKQTFNVTPKGKVLPCHAAETIPGLEFWSVKDHSLREAWVQSPGMNAYRGTEWMKEPCRSCARKEVDLGGCRCQAFALTGDAAATDPSCHLSLHHDLMSEIARQDSGGTGLPVYDYRRFSKAAAEAE